MPAGTVGFIGLGRVGLPLASLLLQADYSVVCCARGRSAELVEQGATIAGDGTPRAVAEAVDVLLVCLPASAIEPTMSGENGVLSAHGPLPTVIELSTAPIELKYRLNNALNKRGGELLDCPVSGTPAMVESGKGVIYASGSREAYEPVAKLLTALSPGVAYVGELGTGTRMKYVANLLVLVHVVVTAEAMALAQAFGLDLTQVAELISRSPAATSGQFAVRAPMIAEGRFDGRMVTIRDARDVLDHVTAAAREVGAMVPMAAVAQQLLGDYGDAGEDDNDPGKLALFLGRVTDAPVAVKTQSKSSGGPRRHTRLYIALSRVGDPAAGPPPPDVIEEHLSWMANVEASGAIFAAGPVVDDNAAILGNGVFIIRAESLADANRIVADDPIHRDGHRACEVFGWEPHQGRITISTTLSDNSTTLG